MSNFKHRWVIVWSNGDTDYLRRKSNGWVFQSIVFKEDGTAVRGAGVTWVATLADVRHDVEAEGGTLEREPNPNYRKPTAKVVRRGEAGFPTGLANLLRVPIR